MTCLSGRGAIVTGSSRGIGARIAGQLAEAGAQVVVNYSGNRGWGLWEPGRWPDRVDMASISQMLVDHVHTPGITLAAVDQAFENSYRNTRY